MRILPVSPVAALLLLAACGAPGEALVPVSEGARGAPPPMLAPTAHLEAALADAGPDAQRLEGDIATLAARAEALRARAGALSGPIVDPGVRPRLEAATSATE